MGFLAPLMLWGGLAASIPILLHLFFRSRYQTVPWAAMKFLLTSIEQTSRRLRFQELLLLILRVSLLLLLAFAFARPLTTLMRGSGQGDAVDAVFLFDTSYSMGAKDGAVTRLERAQSEALRILNHLPPHSTVQIVGSADRPVNLGPRIPSNLDQARTIIQEIKLTHLSGDLFPGVAEAKAILERGQATNKELFVFSDMQKTGWDKRADLLIKSLQDIHLKAEITMVRCGTQMVKNVAIVGIAPQSGIPRPGERVSFAVLVRNSGTEEVRDLKIKLMVDGNKKNVETQSLPSIKPGETRSVPLTAKLEKAGPRVLSAEVENDDLPGDNHFDQVIMVRDSVNLLVIDGGANEGEPGRASSFFLTHALLPIKEEEQKKYYLRLSVVSPRLASPALLQKIDLCILVNVSLKADLKRRAEVLPEDFQEELTKFVRNGKGLIIFAGENVHPENYNQQLGVKRGLLPAKILAAGAQRKYEDPIYLNRKSISLPSFFKFKEDKNYIGFDQVKIWRALEVEEVVKKKETEEKKETETALVPFRYSNNQPTMITKKIGAGEVALITTSADLGFKTDSPNPTWTDWPLNLGMYVPWVNVLVNHMLNEQTQNHHWMVGDTIRWYPRETTTHSYTLIQPDGIPIRLGLPEKIGNRTTITANEINQAGVYRLMTGTLPQGQEKVIERVEDKSVGIPLSVVPDLSESENLEDITKEEINTQCGFNPTHIVAGQEGSEAAGSDRFHREWTLWLLVAVLILTLGESLLAWICGRAW